jgi:methionyl aminopeptidase
MTVQKSWVELTKMHRANVIVTEVLEALGQACQPGVKTRELDKIARDLLARAGARSAFLGYRGRSDRPFPATVCISLNEEVVHGIPGERKLENGDIVSLDFGCVVDGYFGDAARTVPVGKISAQAARLLEVTEEALRTAIDLCRPGRRVGDLGHAIQSYAETHGYSVVREFVGHGIGTSLHEEPQVPNYGPAGRRERLLPGMVLAIEPMVNAGRAEVKTLKDGWTAVTVDKSLSAHFEESVAVTALGPWVLSEPYPYAEAAHA